MADNPWNLTTGGGSSNPWDLSAKPAAKSGGGGGLLGKIEKYSGGQLVGNLASDIGSAGLGVVPGIAKLAASTAPALRKSGGNPADFLYEFLKTPAEQTAAQYKSTYATVNVLHNVYQHPLQPILDALTIASLGAGAGVKAGLLTEGRATVATRSPVAIKTGEGPVLEHVTSPRPFVRGREVGAETVRRKVFGAEGITVPGTDKVVGGEVKRYGKGILDVANTHALGRMQHMLPYLKATAHITPDERAALLIRATGVHPADLAEFWKGTPAEAEVTNPKVVKLVLEPSKRMQRAEPATIELSAQGEQLGHQIGLSEESAAARPDLTRNQVSESLGREAQTIPGGPDPYYFPHVTEPTRLQSPLGNRGGGKAKPRLPGTMKQSGGVLSLYGKLHLRSDVLGAEYLRRVKFIKYDELHNGLLRGSLPVTVDDLAAYGGKLPKGYEYVREKTSTRIPHTMKGESRTPLKLEEAIPNPHDLRSSSLSEGFSTENVKDAHFTEDAAGKRTYFIVPKSTVRAATGEFYRMGTLAHGATQLLNVWRELVLGLRVGFLTNNLIGNSIMYAVRTAGTGGIRNLFQAIVETRGKNFGLKLLRDPAVPEAVRSDLTAEFYPEQLAGLFGRTQSPATAISHEGARAAQRTRYAVTGAIPRVTAKVAEEVPRRAMIRNYMERSPEFKAAYKSLPKETRNYEAAVRKIMARQGGREYQDFISREVDRSLGNYRNLGPVERNVFRNVAPFFAWYKAIVTTTLHLAIDNPLRANLLAQVGDLGAEWTKDKLGDVPSFLAGAIGLGAGKGGTKKVLATQGLNPYGTLSQLLSGAQGNASNLGLNPFVMAFLDAYASAKQSSKSGNVDIAKVALAAAEAVGRGLPPARLIAPLPPSKLYPNRSRKSELFSFLGAPVKEYDPAAAAYQKSIGR